MFTPCRSIFLSERSELLKSVVLARWIFRSQDAEVKRSPRLSSTGKDAVYSVVVGHCWLPLPLRQSVSRMPPLFSLYHIVKERRPFRRYRQFRGCPAYRIDRCSLCFLIRLFTYRFNTAVVWGYNLSVKLYSVHLSPVRSSCHFNRWLGCLIK